MSMAEVMVAMLVLAAGSLAILNLISSAAHSSFRNEQSQVVSDRLQQEMEKIQQLPYEQIALTGLPADSTSTSSPAWRVQGTNYSITHDGTQPAPLVYNGSSLYGGGTVSGGAVDPTPTHFTSGDVGGTVYRYVVWRNDPTCPDSTCPGSQDFKRVIVAITYDTTPTGGTRQYQELFKDLSNPATSPLNDVNPGPACTGGADCSNGSCTGTNCTGGGDPNYTGTPWTFWLTDTSCDNSSRQAITADHQTHNTRGLCQAGQRIGNDPGAPDLMVNQAAPLVTETPLYDYATDVEPAQNAGQDKGLQLLHGSGSGCDSQALTVPSGPEAEQTRFQQLHEWLSPPIPSGDEVHLDGSGTLDLWTESIGGASYAGRICIWLFVRSTDSGGSAVNTAAINNAPPLAGAQYFTYGQTTWPTGWTELHIPLKFTQGLSLSPGTRVGLAVGIDPAGTSSDGLQFLYDEPSFDSRLELKTPTSPPTL